MAELWKTLSVLAYVFTVVTSQIDPRDCPLQCTCTGYDVDCVSTSVFPENLPEVTNAFSLSNSKINLIPSNVFLNLFNLSQIDIRDSTINKISACAFAELEGVTIEFKNVDIKVLEGNSFSNIANSSFIIITDSNIQSMASFSFHNLESIDVFEIVNTNIATIHPYAFRHVKNVTDFSLRNSTVDRFLKEGFSRFYNIEYMYILRSTIKYWQCGSIEIFPDLDDGLDIYVSASRLSCDCSLAWLWRMHSNSSIIHESSNHCYGNDFRLTEITLKDICPSEKKQMSGCPQLLPTTPHTCTRMFDAPYQPEPKVEYPKVFSRTKDDDVMGIAAKASVFQNFFVITFCAMIFTPTFHS